MSDKMRESFEKWLDQGNHCGCNENMWKAWQAAHAAALPPGFVAVPTEQMQAAEREMDRHFEEYWQRADHRAGNRRARVSLQWAATIWHCNLTLEITGGRLRHVRLIDGLGVLET